VEKRKVHYDYRWLQLLTMLFIEIQEHHLYEAKWGYFEIKIYLKSAGNAAMLSRFMVE